MSGELNIGTCKTGAEFEDRIIALLRYCNIEASSTGKEDKGIDIVASATLDGITNKYYIQCKYWNNTVSLHPIQEVYTGTHYFGNDGTPVLLTNNRVTHEARLYARELGVEVIGDAEFKQMNDAMTDGEIENRNFEGLLALLVGACVGNLEYIKNNMHKSSETKEVDAKEKLKLTLINDFDKATEYTKEAARLQQEASYCTQKALALQKDALLKNLEYG